MTKKSIPFPFIFDYLISADVKVKPMFGLWAIYLEDKIILILHQRDENTSSNGIWLATTPEHHESLKKDIPILTSITADTLEETEWQLIPEENEDFEISARKACELILKKDSRVGRIPKPRKRKN